MQPQVELQQLLLVLLEVIQDWQEKVLAGLPRFQLMLLLEC